MFDVKIDLNSKDKRNIAIGVAAFISYKMFNKPVKRIIKCGIDLVSGSKIIKDAGIILAGVTGYIGFKYLKEYSKKEKEARENKKAEDIAKYNKLLSMVQDDLGYDVAYMSSISIENSKLDADASVYAYNILINYLNIYDGEHTYDEMDSNIDKFKVLVDTLENGDAKAIASILQYYKNVDSKLMAEKAAEAEREAKRAAEEQRKEEEESKRQHEIEMLKTKLEIEREKFNTITKAVTETKGMNNATVNFKANIEE